MENRIQIEPSLGLLFIFATFSDYFLILIGSLAALMMGTLQPLFYTYLANIVGNFDENMTSNQFYDDAEPLIFLLLGLGFVFLAIACIAVSCWVRVGCRQALCYREAYLSKLLKMEASWFDERNISEISPAIVNDTLKIQKAAGDKFAVALYILSTVITASIITLYYSIKLSIICFSLMPIVVIGLSMTNKSLQTKAQTSELMYNRAGGVAEEALQEIKTVQALNAQKSMSQIYKQALSENQKAMVLNGMNQGMGMALLIFGVYLAIPILYSVGARDINDGAQNWITQKDTDLVAITVVVIVNIYAAINLASVVPALKVIIDGEVAAGRIQNVLNTPVAIQTGSITESMLGSIYFQNVSFAYPTIKQTPILKQMSFKIQAGQRLGVVGSTGSGKSTIIQLLLRFYEVDEGCIYIDGIPIENFNIAHLRSNIGLVSQEPILFNASITRNIRFGNLKASDEEIENAAKHAGAFNFIENLPNKFQTAVGVKGAQLSGGQKQRIAIARALIRKPKILIMDEATSALDRKTEESVLQSIDTFFSQWSRITIAQNLSTIKKSHNIIILSDGSIKELGTDQELMEMQGKYFHLIKMQQIQKSKVTQEQNMNITQAQEQIFENKMTTTELQKKNYIKKVFKMNAQDKWWVFLGCIGALMVGGISPATSILAGHQYNLLATEDGDDMVSDVDRNSVIVLFLGLGMSIGLFFESLSFPRSTSNITSQMRESSFQSLMNYQPGYFDKPENNSSNLATKLSNDCEKLNILGGTIAGVFVALFAAIATSIIIQIYHVWQMALFSTLLLPILMIGQTISLMGQMKGLVQYSYEQCGAVASDTLMNYRSVQALNLEDEVAQIYMLLARTESNITIKKGTSSGICYGLGFGIVFWCSASMLWMGAYLFKEGEISFLDMIIALTAFTQASDGFFMAGSYSGDIPGGIEAAQRVYGIIEYRAKIDATRDQGSQESVLNRIEFKNVVFSYPSREYKALDNVSFVIEPLSKFAIIGRTGSGKSTITQLLLRFYDPSSGQITIGNVNLKEFNLKYLRKQIGIVSQEPVLFAGTIAENISFGIQAQRDEIQAVSSLAQASEFIARYENGFDREVGFKGSLLSGGQKQRVAIARALIRKPKIVIFDEATSALDSNTEEIVMQNMRTEFAKATWIIIAHRLKTIQEADTILVLESGKVFESGKRENLYKEEGYFYNMINHFQSILNFLCIQIYYKTLLL